MEGFVGAFMRPCPLAFPRVLASAPTGYFAKHLGWAKFFVFWALIAIMELLMLIRIAPLQPQITFAALAKFANPLDLWQNTPIGRPTCINIASEPEAGYRRKDLYGP